MELSPRDLLIDDVQHGRKSPDQAETEAARSGFGPLASEPDPSRFDAMQEVWWTLPMTLAWIYWRSPDWVRELSDAYRDECWDWHFKRWQVPGGPVFEGYFLEQRRRATVTTLVLTASYERVTNQVPRDAPPMPDAKEALWKRLAEGSLQVSAVSSETNQREAIPRDRWLDLEAYEERGKDELHPRADSLIAWCRYRDIRFDRREVMAIWPRRREAPIVPLDNEITSPRGDGYMPLYCAAHWVATLGNKVDVELVTEAAWIVAYRQLLDALASERVKVIGTREGLAEPVPGYHFASCRVHYPYGPLNDSIYDVAEISLRSCPYQNEKEWRAGYDDRLMGGRRDRWIRLMVAKPDVAATWPFGLEKNESDAVPMKSGAPGRPTSMHLVKAEHLRRCENGEAEEGVNAEARALAEWLPRAHPHAPYLQAASIANGIRADHRAWREKARN